MNTANTNEVSELLYKLEQIRLKEQNEIIETYVNSEMQSTIKHIMAELSTNGICAVKGALTIEDLYPVQSFMQQTEDGIGVSNMVAGYVLTEINGSIFECKGYEKILPDDGQCRWQSKSLIDIHDKNEIIPPFLFNIVANEFICGIFALYNANILASPYRVTIDWILPREINHNGWHFDTVKLNLKAMILLDDVTLDTAPMFYAEGSHISSNDFIMQLKQEAIVNGLNKANEETKHYGAHSQNGKKLCANYIGDDFADNAPNEITTDDIIIGGDTYKKFVATGKAGDIIFFDVRGLHSGNIAKTNIRRTMTLSSPSDWSKMNREITSLFGVDR